MKKIFSFFIIVSMLFGMTVPVYANDEVKIKVDGRELTDVQAILQNGSTLLPVRSVSNALGGEVLWDAATKTVVVTKGTTDVVMPVGEKYIIVNDDVVEISAPAQVVDGRTYVPLRVLGNALDCGITWVNETKTVEIEQKDVQENTGNRDLFASSEKDIPYFLSDGVYLTEGEIVPIPVVGGNWVQWSDRTIIDGEWSYYNDQQVVFITGLKKGNCSLKIYDSSSKKGLIEGDYTEIKVRVVSPSSEAYKKQKAERIASGFDILANQAGIIAAGEQLKKDMGLKPENLYDKMYMEKDGVLIIPIDSNAEMSGTLYMTYDENAGLEVRIDEYNGKTAVFIKGSELASTNVILGYVETENDSMLDAYTYETNMLWHRESIRNSIFANEAFALWEFKLNVVNSNNESFKKQNNERIANGISYEMYLNGEA